MMCFIVVSNFMASHYTEFLVIDIFFFISVSKYTNKFPGRQGKLSLIRLYDLYYRVWSHALILVCNELYITLIKKDKGFINFVW